MARSKPLNKVEAKAIQASWREGLTPIQLRWSARRQLLRRPGFRYGLLLSSIVCVNCLLLNVTGLDSRAEVAWVALFSAGILLVVLILWEAAHVCQAPEDASIEPFPRAGLVEVWIVQSSVLTGWDRGFLPTDRDVLSFLGHRMDFQLPRENIRVVTGWSGGIRNKPKTPGHISEVHLEPGDRAVRLVIRPIAPGVLAYHFQTQLSDWYKRVGSSVGLTVLPPLDRDPTLPIPSLWFPGTVGLSVTAVVAAFVESVWQGGDGVWPTAIALAAWVWLMSVVSQPIRARRLMRSLAPPISRRRPVLRSAWTRLRGVR